MKNLLIFLLLIFINIPTSQHPDPPSWDFDTQLANYFAAETEKIRQKTETELARVENWSAYLDQAREELQDMLGLLPFPERTPLHATTTGTVEHEEFTVEKIHFQALPGLYVTGNLYLPKNLKEKAPAIIYVCGHATVKKDGYNYGAKVNYQHHPAWFARNGYVCLIIDTLQLAEIEGIHHGLHRYDRWWWISRGYTPAGVEAWMGIRAIDYLEGRAEVDPGRIGMTGRSGGGVNSWWVAALDKRIRVAVPVAGITDMEDHVVNGCVEGHCDCMYMFNTFRWDFPKVAALVAPRPLLISNSDRDPIFPIEGVFRIYRQVRRVYEKMDAGDDLALNTAAGPHKDIQELRIHAFRWFNHYFFGRDELIEKTAVKFFSPEQLRVFDQLPQDEINSRIDESFNQVAPPVEEILKQLSWDEAAAQWKDGLRKVFSSWPEADFPPALRMSDTQQSGEMVLTTFAVQSDEQTSLPLFHLSSDKTPKEKSTKVIILDDDNWSEWAPGLAALFPAAAFWKDPVSDAGSAAVVKQALEAAGDLYLVSMRGAGPARFSGDDFKQTQIRKRFYLLGQSLHSMQTWDIRRALDAVQYVNRAADASIQVSGAGLTAGKVLYASLFATGRYTLQLADLPESHLQGPHYPKILRYLDIPAAVLMAAARHEVHLSGGTDEKKSDLKRMLKPADQFSHLSVHFEN